MKKKIIILTLILTLTGAAVLGLTLTSLTPDEAYDSALENNRQTEINLLNLELQKITLENSIKSAGITVTNTYNGRLVKYYTPFTSETNLTVKELNNEKALKQLKLDVITASINFNNAETSAYEAKVSYDEAAAEYSKAVRGGVLSQTEILSLKYQRESLKIVLQQSDNNLEAAIRNLENLVGQSNITVDIPLDYSNPYGINAATALKSALTTDIMLYQADRNAKAAVIKFEIAEKFYDDDETMYISALAGMKSTELAYEKALVSVEISVYDDIDNLKNKYDMIALEKLNNKIKLEAYNSAKNQYSAGIISKTALENSESAYASAKKQLSSKIHDYILTSLRFTLDTGYEL